MSVEETLDEFIDGGLRVQLSNVRKFGVRRPNRLAGDVQGDTDRRSVWYEGEDYWDVKFDLTRHQAGLMSYRIAVWDELPRTGLPESFESHAEYQRHVNTLINAGLIEDATKIWWDLRPSARFPTLEMRITDVCTRVEDAICVAALYLCLLRMLHRLRLGNQRWRRYSAMLVSENRWLAQRYGLERGLVDFGRGQLVPYAQLVEEMLELIREDAEHFDCAAEVEHARTIVQRGTSAHWQIKTYEEAKARGANEKEALEEVVDMLIRESVAGL